MATPDPATTLDDVAVTAPPPAGSSSFVERIITLVIQLGTGPFGNSGSNTITIGPIGGGAATQPYNSLRSVVRIEYASAPFPGLAIVQVFGLTLSQMNQLTIAGTLYDGRKNLISVQAGDSVAGMTTIFNGEIWQAYPRATQPDMAFVMIANPANGPQLTPAQPVSFKGSTNGAAVLTAALAPTGYALENNGVTAILSNPYFHGSAWDQIKAITSAMNAVGYLDSAKMVYAIWPQNGSRSAGSTPLIAPSTGMIGYPEFQQTQIRLQKLFDPRVPLTVGNKIQVQSEFVAANGTWTIKSVTHDISAQLEDGPWETSIMAVNGVAGS